MGLLYADKIDIDSVISVRIPTVGEVMKDADAFMGLAGLITATPYDCLVELDDAGIDFSKISDFDLFLMNYGRLAQLDTAILFGDFDFGAYKMQQVEGGYLLVDEASGHKINWVMHRKIASAIRKMLGTKRNTKKPGNDEARRYMIERARIKRDRARSKKSSDRLSFMESKIAAIVNSSGSSYTYESIKEITLFQLTTSFEQIVKIKNYDNLMFGYYSGNVKLEKVPETNKTWIL